MKRTILSRVVGLAVLSLAYQSAPAAPQVPTAAFLAERTARRYPQPVRAGDLIDRKLLAPKEQQPVLGRVSGIVRQKDGTTSLVIKIGGWFGLGGRLVAVPIDAIGLLGEFVALLDVTPEQMRQSATFEPASATNIAADEMINVGLVKPFH